MFHLGSQINYWYTAAERSWKTAQYLLTGKRYDACLFFCHLALEKVIKGLVILETKELAPYIHDLPKLANLAKVSCSPEQVAELRVITTFNIAGRYDTEKMMFYKHCTKEYTQLHFKEAKRFFLWLKKKYPPLSGKK